MQTYRQKHLTQTVTYELGEGVLRVVGTSLLGKTFEASFPLGQIEAEPDRIWTPNDAIQQVWSIALLLVAFVPVVVLGVAGAKVVDLQPAKYIWIWAAAIAVCIAGWALAPRIEHATFRFKSGEPAVTIARSGAERAAFDAFVASVREAARMAA